MVPQEKSISIKRRLEACENQERKGEATKVKLDKKSRNAIILLCALAVLLICYFSLVNYNKKKKEKAQEKEEKETIYLTDMDSLQAIRYDAGNGEMHFEKKDDSWYVTDDPDFPLSQSTVDALAKSVGHLKALRELKDGDTLADYGLEEPSYWIEITGEDGNTIKISVGNAIDSAYYARVDDSKTVYTVSSTLIEELQTSLEEMAELDVLPTIGSGNFVKETIAAPGQQEIVYQKDNDEDTEAVAVIAGGLGALTLDQPENYSVSDEELSQYGLDENTRTKITVIYTEDEKEQTLVLWFGNETGDENVYVMPEDSKIVYRVSKEVCDNILNQNE